MAGVTAPRLLLPITQIPEIAEDVDEADASIEDQVEARVETAATAVFDLANPLDTRGGGAALMPPAAAGDGSSVSSVPSTMRVYRTVYKPDRRSQAQIGYFPSILSSMSWDKLIGVFKNGCERFCALRKQVSCSKECYDHLAYLALVNAEITKRPERRDLTEETALKLEGDRADVIDVIEHCKRKHWIHDVYELGIPPFYQNYDVLSLSRSIAICLAKGEPSIEEFSLLKEAADRLGPIFFRLTGFDLNQYSETGPTRKSYLEALLKAMNDLADDSPFKPKMIVIPPPRDDAASPGPVLSFGTPASEEYPADFEMDIDELMANLKLSCNTFAALEESHALPDEYRRVWNEICIHFQNVVHVLATEVVSPELAFELECMRLALFNDMDDYKEKGYLAEDCFAYIPIFYLNPSVHDLRRDLALACTDAMISQDEAQRIKEKAQSLGAAFLEEIHFLLDAPLDTVDQRRAFLEALAKAIDDLPENSPFKPKIPQLSLDDDVSDHASRASSAARNVFIEGFDEFYSYLDASVGVVIGSPEHAAALAMLHVLKQGVAPSFRDQIEIGEDLSITMDRVTEAYRKYKASIEDVLEEDGDG